MLCFIEKREWNRWTFGLFSLFILSSWSFHLPFWLLQMESRQQFHRQISLYWSLKSPSWTGCTCYILAAIPCSSLSSLNAISHSHGVRGGGTEGRGNLDACAHIPHLISKNPLLTLEKAYYSCLPIQCWRSLHHELLSCLSRHSRDREESDACYWWVKFQVKGVISYFVCGRITCL